MWKMHESVLIKNLRVIDKICGERWGHMGNFVYLWHQIRY